MPPMPTRRGSACNTVPLFSVFLEAALGSRERHVVKPRPSGVRCAPGAARLVNASHQFGSVMTGWRLV
jgi:hypothetical protein